MDEYDYIEEDYWDEYEEDYGEDGPVGDISTTGVKMTKEEGMAHLLAYPLREGMNNYSYAIMLEEDDGSFNIVERNGMPCWGALREYECGTRPQDDWPGDLRTNRHIFPKTGKPVAVAACFQRMSREAAVIAGMGSWSLDYHPAISDWNTFIEFVFDPELSPWRGALKDVELLKAENGMYWGCVFKDVNIDPNIMVSLLRCNVTMGTKAKNFANYLRLNPEVDKRVAYLACESMDGYYLSGRIIPEAWFNGTTTGISDGGTFASRESYNRPDIQYIFGGKGNAGVNISGMSKEQLTALIPV